MQVFGVFPFLNQYILLHVYIFLTSCLYFTPTVTFALFLRIFSHSESRKVHENSLKGILQMMRKVFLVFFSWTIKKNKIGSFFSGISSHLLIYSHLLTYKTHTNIGGTKKICTQLMKMLRTEKKVQCYFKRKFYFMKLNSQRV